MKYKFRYNFLLLFFFTCVRYIYMYECTGTTKNTLCDTFMCVHILYMWYTRSTCTRVHTQEQK
jgi:hypothetical protein